MGGRLPACDMKRLRLTQAGSLPPVSAHSIFMKTFFYYILLLLLVALTACSHDTDEPHDQSGHPKGTLPVELTISVPTTGEGQQLRTAVPDPGTDTGENVAWDSLLLVVTYTQKDFDDVNNYEQNPNQTVYYVVFRRSDFERNAEVTGANATTLTPLLNADGTDSHARRFTMYLPAGTVRTYGITYATSQLKVFNPEDSVRAVMKDKDLEAYKSMERWLIPNTYGSVAYSQATGYTGLDAMLSVATGYGTDADTHSQDLVITKEHGQGYMHEFWSMPLTRLAVKYDIQWDAARGFTVDKNGHVLTDVEVTDFKYDGRASLPADAPTVGYGRWFPALQAADVKPVGGQSTFQNTTAVSQRNGRVTHCVFPDGVRNVEEAPQLVFTLNKHISINNAAPVASTGTVALNFKEVLNQYGFIQPATWYKVSVTIKGGEAQSNTVIVKN